MRTLLMVSAVLMTACGPMPEEAEKDTKVMVSEGDDEGEAEKVVVEYEKHEDVFVQLFEFLFQVPECTDALVGKYVKVKSQNIVMQCHVGRWVETDLDPNDVKIVLDDTPEMPEGENVWRDPVSKVIYLVGDQFDPAVMDYANLCGDGWALASRTEAQAAINHGLLLAKGTIIDQYLLYIQDGNPDDQLSAAIVVASGKIETTELREGQGMLCVLKK